MGRRTVRLLAEVGPATMRNKSETFYLNTKVLNDTCAIKLLIAKKLSKVLQTVTVEKIGNFVLVSTNNYH